MSIWGNLLGWALKTAKTEGQQVGIQALHDVTGQLNNVLSEHAPDMAPMLQPLLQQLISSTVAGIMTKSH